jgi:hypothetical protein
MDWQFERQLDWQFGKVKMPQYGLCRNFEHWGLIPPNFDERKDKIWCPVCNRHAHPHYTGHPSEVGLSDKHKVEYELK